MRKTLGMLIAEQRKQKGLTQLQLAQQMGVTDKAVSKWERDLSCPDIHTIPHLAETLGLSVEELMQTNTVEKPDLEITIHLSTIARAVALAMGVAVAVLSILDQISTRSAMTMLGIGLACAAASLLGKKE